MMRKQPLSKDQIREIAEELDCGMACFWNRQNNELIFLPNPENPFIEDSEKLRELQNLIAAAPDEFEELKALSTFDSLQIMESFTDSLDEKLDIKKKLFKALLNDEAFAQFNATINKSEYRQAWIDYKFLYLSNYVMRWEKHVEEIRSKIKREK